MQAVRLGAIAVLVASTLSIGHAHAVVAGDVVQELIRQVRADVAEMRECRPPKGPPVDVQPLDLDGGGEPAYLLTSIASCECGQVDCSQWIYRRTSSGFAQLLQTEGYRLSVGRTRHRGLFDLEVEARDSAASVDHRRYAFDGTRYRAAADALEDVRTGDRKAMQRVRFARGRTGTVLDGHARFGFADRWVLGAQAGQTLSLSLVPGSSRSTAVTVIGPTTGDGFALRSFEHWRGVLPVSGDYTIVVEADGDERIDYRLDVDIGARR